MLLEIDPSMMLHQVVAIGVNLYSIYLHPIYFMIMRALAWAGHRWLQQRECFAKHQMGSYYISYDQTMSNAGAPNIHIYMYYVICTYTTYIYLRIKWVHQILKWCAHSFLFILIKVKLKYFYELLHVYYLDSFR